MENIDSLIIVATVSQGVGYSRSVDVLEEGKRRENSLYLFMHCYNVNRTLASIKLALKARSLSCLLSQTISDSNRL